MTTPGVEGALLYLSPQFERLLGFSAAEWRAQPDLWISQAHPADRAQVLAAVEQFERTSAPLRMECRYLARDGRTVWIEEQAVHVRDSAGRPLYTLGNMSDITARKEAEGALRTSGQHLQALIENAPIGACIVDEQDIFQTVNTAFCALLGYTREELVGHAVTMLYPQHAWPASTRQMLQHTRELGQAEGEVELVAKGGRVVMVLSTMIPITSRAGQPQRASFIVDITERIQREQSLAHLAHYDALTSLPNRTLFGELTEHAVARARRHKQIVAVVFVDLDGFKAVNDTWGHAVGDALLQEVARCLRRAIRESDGVARLGGDEFAVVLPDIGSGAHTAAVARKILAALGQGFDVEGHRLVPTASIGISLYPFAGQGKRQVSVHSDYCYPPCGE